MIFKWYIYIIYYIFVRVCVCVHICGCRTPIPRVSPKPPRTLKVTVHVKSHEFLVTKSSILLNYSFGSSTIWCCSYPLIPIPNYGAAKQQQWWETIYIHISGRHSGVSNNKILASISLEYHLFCFLKFLLSGHHDITSSTTPYQIQPWSALVKPRSFASYHQTPLLIWCRRVMPPLLV